MRIVFGSHLRMKCIDLRKTQDEDDPHSMLYVSSNTIEQRKCVISRQPGDNLRAITRCVTQLQLALATIMV